MLQVPTGRGGSVELHTVARVGQHMTVRGPRDHFPLVASPAYLFIAGGIGITPLMAMATRAASTGCEWRLVYGGRRRATMAFVDEVRALGANRVDVLARDERGRPNLPAIINAAPPGAAVYCCGPGRMLESVREQVLTETISACTVSVSPAPLPTATHSKWSCSEADTSSTCPRTARFYKPSTTLLPPSPSGVSKVFAAPAAPPSWPASPTTVTNYSATLSAWPGQC